MNQNEITLWAIVAVWLFLCGSFALISYFYFSPRRRASFIEPESRR